jgi:HrpA-like RNA helicase
MSATIHTELYRGYFSQGDEYFGDLDCLSVGVRRFPLNILYVEDIRLACQGKYNPPNPGTCNFNLPSGLIGPADSIDRGLKAGKISTEVYPTVVKDQYALAVGLIKSIGVNGTSVLVFVSGIADITELSEKFETLARYKVIAIHSDIPFEEQEAAFTPAAANEVKVILATNAAESSITLPDCDVVICLGTHKSLRYEATSHRVQLVNTWVSKASATQRAGEYILYIQYIHVNTRIE